MERAKATDAEADALMKATDVIHGAIVQAGRDEGISAARLISALALASATIVAREGQENGLEPISTNLHFLNAYRAAAADLALNANPT